MEAADRDIWQDGVKLLLGTGGKEREVRSLLGQLAKTHGKQHLADAIRQTVDQDPADPRGYLIGILRDRARKSSVGKSQVDETPASCSDCNDTKKVFVKKSDARYDWELTPQPCPKCS